jgi:DNA-binding NtrC family response regulator
MAVEELVGQRCEYHWEADSPAARVPAALAPPPEVFTGQQVRSLVVTGVDEHGMRCRWATFVPLVVVDAVAAVLIVLDRADCEDGQALLRQESAGEESAWLHLRLAGLRQRLGPLYELHQLVGESPAIQRVRDQVQAAVASGSRVLIVGPEGSGREHVARTIYYLQGPGDAGALVPLSCSLLDAELLQTTISAFIHTRPEIEVTGPAALLLLDVADLSPDAQRSLMAVLNIVELRAHTLATSRESLVELARDGRFRQDLAHHLSTLVIELPALVERAEDIPLLAQKILEACNARTGRQLSGFSSEALDQLSSYSWPNNVDELTLAIHEAHRRASGPRVEASDLPATLREVVKAAAHPLRPAETIELDKFLESIETELIVRALRQAKGNRARAARLLGITRTRLLRRLGQLGLE